MDASEWDERYATTDLVWSEAPNQFVVEQVSAAGLLEGRGRRALDLGCGEGRNAIWLAARGWSVTGVDYSSKGIDTARALASRREVDVEWIVGDATEWTAGDRGFALVVVAYLQMPPEQQRAALRTAVASLAPDGTLVVVAHHSDNLEHGTGGPQDPAVLFTQDDVVEHASVVAAEMGVRLEVEVAMAAERAVPDAPRPAIDTVVRMHRVATTETSTAATGGSA
jgi:SAM-dependent methyltransferase